MRLGFQEDERVAVLMRATSSASRPMKINGWQWPGQKRPRRGGVFPAQAQVAAWARRRRARAWLGRAAGLSELGWATTEAAGSWAESDGARGWTAGCWAGNASARVKQAMGRIRWATRTVAGSGRNGQTKVRSQFFVFLFSRKQFDQFELDFYDNFLYKIYPTIFFVQ